jgi:GT2 family glycosyltransferase
MDTLFAQTRLPDEIVVADGESTDETIARVMEYADRGVPIRIVNNESHYVGGGRNAGTRAASHEIVAIMDMGNRADPGWLEAMLQPFIDDPDVEYVGGIWYPMLDSWFARVSGAVIYFEDCLGMTWDFEELLRNLPPDPLPGGMSMAYRKPIFERAGGFSEWLKKGQDRLFSYRVRKIGGKIQMSLKAVMYHHMADSFGEVWGRHFHYGLWAARVALPRRRFRKLSLVYGSGLLLLALSLAFPWLLVPMAILALAYMYVGAWRKLFILTKATGEPFSLKQWFYSPLVLFARDAAVLSGNILGGIDRLTRPKWRRLTHDYSEHGRQP